MGNCQMRDTAAKEQTETRVEWSKMQTNLQMGKVSPFPLIKEYWK